MTGASTTLHWQLSIKRQLQLSTSYPKSRSNVYTCHPLSSVSVDDLQRGHGDGYTTSSPSCEVPHPTENKSSPLTLMVASLAILLASSTIFPDSSFAIQDTPPVPTSSTVDTPSLDTTTYKQSSYRSTALHNSIMMATVDLSAEDEKYFKELGLKLPTENRPQIMLNDRAVVGNPAQQQTKPIRDKANVRVPILQGLVYFPERARDAITRTYSTASSTASSTTETTKQPMDYYSDVLVITAVSINQPNGPILAGAKFPVSTVRFPFSFQMYEENLLLNRPGVKDAWYGTSSSSKEGGATNEDIILRARICPSDAASLPCDDVETKKYAEGVAKLISNLPGLNEGAVIRAPASLPLH
jgi:hypothetical protein